MSVPLTFLHAGCRQVLPSLISRVGLCCRAQRFHRAGVVPVQTVTADVRLTHWLRVPQRSNHSAPSNPKPTKSVIFSDESTRSPQLTQAEKVKEGTKDAGYLMIVVVAVAATGLVLIFVLREVFSSQSPSGLYSLAYDRCKADIRVQAVLGEPIKCYGEMSGRGRRRHVAHHEFQDSEGVRNMLMKFYMEGPHNKATVHLHCLQEEDKSWKYRYLLLETERFPQQTIVVENNTKETKPVTDNYSLLDE